MLSVSVLNTIIATELTCVKKSCGEFSFNELKIEKVKFFYSTESNQNIFTLTFLTLEVVRSLATWLLTKKVFIFLTKNQLKCNFPTLAGK